jgi:hypothetical protein
MKKRSLFMGLYRKRAELLQIQNCPPQMFQGAQLLRLTSSYAAIGDSTWPASP